MKHVDATASPTDAPIDTPTDTPIDTGASTLEQQIMFFRTFGALRVRGLFAAEIETISQGFDEVFRANPVHEVTSPFSLHRLRDPDQGTTPRRQIPSPDVVASGDPAQGFIERSPKLSWLRDDPRVTALAQALLGDGYQYEGSVGNIFNSYIYWHSDYFRSSIPPETRLKFGFYLEPLDADSGALRVIPGTNHLGAYRDLLYDEVRETKPGHMERLFGVAEDDLPCWAISVTPGDLVVFDNTTLHSNFNGGPHRRLFTIGFTQPAPNIEQAAPSIEQPAPNI
jgi:Phytanoyl-CoA dioxygenase (PhyH)